MISIHALLAESDHPDAGGIQGPRNFYPRSPCGERPLPCYTGTTSVNFYPRSPCGERPDKHAQQPTQQEISIHALLAESDPPRVIREPTTPRFLSTLSLRRATYLKRDLAQSEQISIHALLAESDCPGGLGCVSSWLFLSTLSLRRATAGNKAGAESFKFLSTLSLRRATIGHTVNRHPESRFLSTLSLRRATCYSFRHSAPRWYFYPRSPCGERRWSRTFWHPKSYFYPRSPCGERR